MISNTGLTTPTPAKFTHLGFGHGGSKRLPVLEQYTAPDGVRFYNTPTGEKYPSVTTVLSQKGKEVIEAHLLAIGYRGQRL
jgi:hypothetical protein